MSEKHMVRGSFLGPTHKFLVQNYPPERVQKVIAQLSPEVRDTLPNVKVNEWYPLHYVTELLRGVYESHEDPKEAYEAVVRCGRFVGDEATTTFLRLLMKMMTLPMLAAKWQQFWGKYNNFGICVADAAGINEKKFVVTANPGYPYVHGIGAGWIFNVLAAMGKTGVKIDVSVPLGQVEAPEIRWVATWD